MTPRQTIAMVTCWAIAPAIVAAAIALPAGMALHTRGHPRPRQRPAALPQTLSTPPASLVQVYTPGGLTLLALAAAALAAIGALGPATWAAASRTTTALHAE